MHCFMIYFATCTYMQLLRLWNPWPVQSTLLDHDFLYFGILVLYPRDYSSMNPRVSTRSSLNRLFHVIPIERSGKPRRDDRQLDEYFMASMFWYMKRWGWQRSKEIGFESLPSERFPDSTPEPISIVQMEINRSNFNVVVCTSPLFKVFNFILS